MRTAQTAGRSGAAGVLSGLVIGLALGALLHMLLAESGAATSREPALPVAPREASSVELPAARLPEPARVRAEPLLPAPAPAITTLASGGAAADALVGILVQGAVIDTEGLPVPPGNRRISFDDGLHAPRWVEVGPASTYAASGLSPGAWTVSLDAENFRPFTTRIELSAERPVVRLDLVLTPSVVLLIKGYTPSGEPLLDAVVRELGNGDEWRAPRLSAIATREAPVGDLPATSHRGYDRWGIGSYRDRMDSLWQGPSDLPLDVMGRLEIDESLPVFVSLVLRHVLVGTQRVEADSKEVVFVVQVEALQALLGTVRLRVEDVETRKVPAGVSASLSDSQSSGVGTAPASDGTFTWEDQRPGLLELSIDAPDHETWDQIVSVPAGGVADLGTIELTPATKLSGTVVDGAGNPVAVRLRALRDDTSVGLGMGERRYAQSDAAGAFEIGGLGRHRYRVVISAEQWAALPVFVDARSGDVSNVRVVAEAGVTLRLRTLWPANDSYGLRVTRSDGIAVAASESWRGDWAWTKLLPRGSYTVALLRDGQELKRVPVTLAAEDVVVELEP